MKRKFEGPNKATQSVVADSCPPLPQGIVELVEKKQLSCDLFINNPIISPSDPFSTHVERLFEFIYSQPYPGEKPSKKIARSLHGIQHVTRVSIYVPVLANLYRQFEDPLAINLTSEDIRLLQLAALFHDSAREEETGEDKWDHESGILLYVYLTKVFAVDKTRAKLIAEAIANKDPRPNGYVVIHEDASGEITWGNEPVGAHAEDNIYIKLIHDVDCLDIIRVKGAKFDETFLHFYQQFADNPNARLMMSRTIQEVTHFIDNQGDLPKSRNRGVKERYENRHAYSVMKDLIRQKPEDFPLLAELGEGLLSYTLSPQKAHQLLLDTVFQHSAVLQELKQRFKKTKATLPNSEQEPDATVAVHPKLRLSQSELHLKLILGANYKEDNLADNVRGALANLKIISIPMDKIEVLSEQLIEFIEYEKQHPEQMYFYHACDEKVAFLYHLYSIMHQILQANPEWAAFRGSNVFFKSFETIQQVIAHYSQEGKKEINNDEENFAELALSVNIFLFGNHNLKSSNSIRYYTKNHVMREIELKPLLHHVFGPVGVAEETIDTLLRFYHEYFSGQGGALYQIGIPHEEITNRVYPCTTKGRKAAYMNSLDLNKIMTILQHKTEFSDEDKEYVQSLQARVLISPTQPLSLRSARLEALPDAKNTASKKAMQRIMQNIIQSILTHDTGFEKAPLIRVYQKIMVQHPDIEPSKKFSPALLVEAIVNNHTERVKTILTTHPEFINQTFFYQPSYFKEKKAAVRNTTDLPSSMPLLDLMVYVSDFSAAFISDYFGKDWITQMHFETKALLLRALDKDDPSLRLKHLQQLMESDITLLIEDQEMVLIRFVLSVPQEERLDLVNFLWERLSRNMESLGPNNIGSILFPLTDFQKAQFLESIGNQKIKDILRVYPAMLKDILCWYPEKNLARLADDIGLEWLKNELGGESQQSYFKDLPRPLLVYCFGEVWIQKLRVNRLSQLITILNRVSDVEERWRMFKNANLQSIKDNPKLSQYDLVPFLHQFPAEMRLAVIEQLGMHFIEHYTGSFLSVFVELSNILYLLPESDQVLFINQLDIDKIKKNFPNSSIAYLQDFFEIMPDAMFNDYLQLLGHQWLQETIISYHDFLILLRPLPHPKRWALISLFDHQWITDMMRGYLDSVLFLLQSAPESERLNFIKKIQTPEKMQRMIRQNLPVDKSIENKIIPLLQQLTPQEGLFDLLQWLSKSSAIFVFLLNHYASDEIMAILKSLPEPQRFSIFEQLNPKKSGESLHFFPRVPKANVITIPEDLSKAMQEEGWDITFLESNTPRF